jgi:hypothetical protein
VDFDLALDQARRRDALRALTREHHDDLDAALWADGPHTASTLTLLDRILLVEEAARLEPGVDATAALLMAPLVAPFGPRPPVAVTAGPREAPVRSALVAHSVLHVSETGVRIAPLGPGEVRPIASGLGRDYGVVSTAPGEVVAWPLSLDPLTTYRLGLAAEIAGGARAALGVTAAYLTERRQFGRPLAKFQALRHRMSERAVDVAATPVLVRYAASTVSRDDALGAVAYAARTAAALAPDLHQLCGARGFMTDFGLARCTMAVEALRVLLGGTVATAVQYADAAWGSGHGG